jgi:hypothetical protein
LLGNRTWAPRRRLELQFIHGDVTLAITNVRTTQVMATIDGHSKKTDIGFGLAAVCSAMAVSARRRTGYQQHGNWAGDHAAYLDAYTSCRSAWRSAPSGGRRCFGGSRSTDGRGDPRHAMFSQPPRKPGGASDRSGHAALSDRQQERLMWEVKDDSAIRLGSSIMFELAK